MKNPNFWKTYSWVNLGSQRREVVKFLTDKPIAAEELRRKVNDRKPMKLSLREMSRHLTSFVGKGLMECLNPEAPYNRLYSITPLGKKIRIQILEK